MNAREILDPLRQNERASRERGVSHAALFGCAARGEPRSDIDITVEIAPDVRVGVIAYVGIGQFIEDMFPTAGRQRDGVFRFLSRGDLFWRALDLEFSNAPRHAETPKWQALDRRDESASTIAV
jgi:uncharacterized protein